MTDHPRRPAPGQYGLHEEDDKYPSVARDKEELTSRTDMRLRASLNSDDYELVKRIVVSRRESSFPPPTKKDHAGRTIAISILTGAIMAVAAAAVSVYRNDAVSQEHQRTTDARIDNVIRDERDHEKTSAHPGTAAALASIESKLQALNERLARIERQLDSQRAAVRTTR